MRSMNMCNRVQNSTHVYFLYDFMSVFKWGLLESPCQIILRAKVLKSKSCKKNLLEQSRNFIFSKYPRRLNLCGAATIARGAPHRTTKTLKVVLEKIQLVPRSSWGSTAAQAKQRLEMNTNRIVKIKYVCFCLYVATQQWPVAVFLILCDPSMNELWVT